MEILYKKGDICFCSENYILHGCNAQGKMASGVAKALRLKYPQATWDVYNKKFNTSGLNVGDIIIGTQNNKTIFNCITQKYYGYDGKLYFDYDTFKNICIQIDSMTAIDNIPFTQIAMPKIGAGLAGGDWKTISNIIETNFKLKQPVVYEID